VPQVFRVGLGMPWRLGPEHRVYVEADAFHPSDNTESMSLGAEYSFRGKFALRAGYQNMFLQDAEGGLSAGAGFADNSDPLVYRIDYAWAGHGRLGDTHRISLGINF
jgi:long-subunit fatty acid transport protein